MTSLRGSGRRLELITIPVEIRTVSPRSEKFHLKRCLRFALMRDLHLPLRHQRGEACDWMTNCIANAPSGTEDVYSVRFRYAPDPAGSPPLDHTVYHSLHLFVLCTQTRHMMSYVVTPMAQSGDRGMQINVHWEQIAMMMTMTTDSWG